MEGEQAHRLVTYRADGYESRRHQRPGGSPRPRGITKLITLASKRGSEYSHEWISAPLGLPASQALTGEPDKWHRR